MLHLENCRRSIENETHIMKEAAFSFVGSGLDKVQKVMYLSICSPPVPMHSGGLSGNVISVFVSTFPFKFPTYYLMC